MRAAVTGFALILIIGAAGILLATPWLRADPATAVPDAVVLTPTARWIH